eukprot:3054758-Rhodomonas_salina.1
MAWPSPRAGSPRSTAKRPKQDPSRTTTRRPADLREREREGEGGKEREGEGEREREGERKERGAASEAARGHWQGPGEGRPEELESATAHQHKAPLAPHQKALHVPHTPPQYQRRAS